MIPSTIKVTNRWPLESLKNLQGNPQTTKLTELTTSLCPPSSDKSVRYCYIYVRRMRWHVTQADGDKTIRRRKTPWYRRQSVDIFHWKSTKSKACSFSDSDYVFVNKWQVRLSINPFKNARLKSNNCSTFIRIRVLCLHVNKKNKNF